MAPRLAFTDYTIGWICALPLELAAALLILDVKHEAPVLPYKDNTNYHFGSIAGHNIVVACLPDTRTGTIAAASVVADMMRMFCIELALVVGIAGGIPSTDNDIRLGDVVVSKPTDQHAGVIQYDFGKVLEDGGFLHSHRLNRPHRKALSILSIMEALQESQLVDIETHVLSAVAKAPRFGKPDANTDLDLLFEAEYKHIGEPGSSCDNCDRTRLVSRPQKRQEGVQVHFGNILSGNSLMRSATVRDRLGNHFKALCFEMEASGVYEESPSLVIRGICDYSDSHKNKGWQRYAAITAAAYAKELIRNTNIRAPSPPVAMNELIQTISSYDSGQAQNRSEVLQSIPEKLRAWQVWIYGVADRHQKQLPNVSDSRVTEIFDHSDEHDVLDEPGIHQDDYQMQNTVPLSFALKITSNESSTSALTDHAVVPSLSEFRQLQAQALQILLSVVGSYVKQSHLYKGYLTLSKVLGNVPSPMSFFLSDNITLLDANNDLHSLPFQYFQAWSTFDSMVQYHFRDHPGANRIASGEYSIVVQGQPQHILSGDNWENLKPKMKLEMIVNFGSLTTSAKVCLVCHRHLSRYRTGPWQCSNCETSYYSGSGQTKVEADTTSLRLFGSEVIRRSTSNSLSVPRSPLSTLLYSSILPGEQQMAPQQRTADTIRLRPMDTEEVSFSVNVLWPMGEDSKTVASISGQKLLKILSQSSDDTENPESQEKDQIQLFKRVRVIEESTIYQAVVRLDWSEVERQLQKCDFLDAECGEWGTTLTAAVLSGSRLMVYEILSRGADPLLSFGPLGSPLRVAALHGHSEILFDLILHAKQEFKRKQSGRPADSRAFYVALHTALGVATHYSRLECIKVLLHFGANPFTANTGELTPFLNAIRMGHHRIASVFINAANERDLLDEYEYIVFTRALSAEDFLEQSQRARQDLLDSIDDHELRFCVDQLLAGRGRLLQTWITARLKSKGPYEWIGREPALERFFSTYSEEYGPFEYDPIEGVPKISVTPP